MLDHGFERDKKVFNVLHVASSLPVGGVETTIYNEIAGYDKTRYRASACCIREGGEISDALARSGFKVTVLNKMQGHGFDVGAIRALCRLIKKEDIHILRTHQYHANLYGRLAGILARVPTMIPSFHNVYDFPRRHKIHRSLINKILAFFSDRLIACSTVVSSDMMKYDRVPSGKVRVIYNTVHEAVFKSTLQKEEARRLLGLPHDETIIGTLGRLDEQKGHRYLIQAVSGLENATVAIAGDGPLLSELRGLSGSLNSRINFLGMIKPEQVPAFLRALDIFCFPSLWEGFGIAVAEAMAAGLAIVASDIPPLREVLGGTGLLVPPANAAGLRTALERLISNDALRESLQARARERSSLFSIEKYIAAYESLFEELLLQKGML